MKLHKVFTRTGKASRLIGDAIGGGYFRAEKKEQLRQLKKIAAGLAGIYKVTTPKVEHAIEAVPGGAYACYRPMIKTISIKNTSLVSFLHEYRHHLQYEKKTFHDASLDIEHDAQAWACSVYYNAKPGLFKKAVQQGRIMGVTAADLA